MYRRTGRRTKGATVFEDETYDTFEALEDEQYMDAMYEFDSAMESAGWGADEAYRPDGDFYEEDPDDRW